MRMRSIAVGAAALVAATAAAVVPTITSASASTTFQTSTISAEHPDTTGISCSACLQGPGGPIWANDHLKEAVKVTSAGAPGHYNVTIRFGGSTFEGFADPRAAGEAGSDGSTSGGPMFSQGAITGSITYNDIASTNQPGPVTNPEPPGTSLGAVLNQVFANGNSPAVFDPLLHQLHAVHELGRPDRCHYRQRLDQRHGLQPDRLTNPPLSEARLPQTPRCGAGPLVAWSARPRYASCRPGRVSPFAFMTTNVRKGST